jgi:hypothetical protein
MKTKNNKVLLATLAISALALVAVTKMAASALPVLVIAGSYLAVVILFALAALDYRVGPKAYWIR